MSLNCVILGAGNLATHLATQLYENGIKILQIFSRTEKSSKELAEKINALYTSNPESIIDNADIYFVALKDDIFHLVLPLINFNNHLIVHCAGSLLLSDLDHYSENTGVLYPLQTFSKNKVVDFKNIPVFIEANSEKNLSVLKSIAEKISGNVKTISSEQRMVLHIAAVFACNFTNHLYALAEQLLNDNGLQFEMIRPLILETAEKINTLQPSQAQTGPAVRNDLLTMGKHIEALSGNKELAELYKTISKSIFELHKKSD